MCEIISGEPLYLIAKNDQIGNNIELKNVKKTELKDNHMTQSVLIKY